MKDLFKKPLNKYTLEEIDEIIEQYFDSVDKKELLRDLLKSGFQPNEINFDYFKEEKKDIQNQLNRKEMEKMKKVKVKKNFYYDPELQTFTYCVTVSLPSRSDDSSFIDDIYMNKYVEFFGEKLSSFWGNKIDKETGMVNLIKYFFEDKPERLDEFKKDMDEYINKEMDKLKKVVETNKRKISNIPKPKESVFKYKDKEIKIRREYSFNTQYQEYKCLITVFFPTDDHGRLDETFVNPKIEIFGSRLDYRYGSISKMIINKDLNILIKDVENYIETELEKLNRIEGNKEEGEEEIKVRTLIEETKEEIKIDDDTNIKLKKEFYKNNLDDCYLSFVTVSINTDKNGNIPNFFLKWGTTFFEKELKSKWGILKEDTNERTETVVLKSSQLDKLKNEVEKYINDEINKIQEIVKVNKEMMTYIPNNSLVEKVEFDI